MPETKRPNENIKAFTLRQMRNEIIEECAKAAAGVPIYTTRAEIAQIIRALKDPDD